VILLKVAFIVNRLINQIEKHNKDYIKLYSNKVKKSRILLLKEIKGNEILKNVI